MATISEFHFWLLDCIISSFDFAELSAGSAVYDIACNIHLLYLKHLCLNTDKATEALVKMFLWKSIRGNRDGKKQIV
jgi:hypothetical protein